MSGMNVSNRVYLCGVVIALNVCGCVERKPSPPRASQPPAPATTDPDARPEPILLRGALLPDERPQQITVEFTDERETLLSGLPPVIYRLHLRLTAELSAGRADGEQIAAELAFKRVELTLGAVGPEATPLSFDSARDGRGRGNPLADVMSAVADATCALRLTTTGRLRELSGLDARWRRANLLMVPPGLFAAQWLFRDAGMTKLIAAALFPPMPAGPVRPGDAWEIDASANIPLIARIDSRLRSTLQEIGHGDPARVVIRGVGQLVASVDLPDDLGPAIRPRIRSGSETVIQTIVPDDHMLTQDRQSELDAEIVMTPPRGDNSQVMQLKRRTRLSSQRIFVSELSSAKPASP
jgi:hypothetical protein